MDRWIKASRNDRGPRAYEVVNHNCRCAPARYSPARRKRERGREKKRDVSVDSRVARVLYVRSFAILRQKYSYYD